MRINQNMPALNSYRAISRTNKKVENAMKRISSGFKINSVKDDAAGLAISNKLHNQLLGLEKASRNSMDGISAIQTAEGATQEIHNMLQRIRELAIQSSNDTYTPPDRRKIHEEVGDLLDEITAITSRTEHNTIKLLNGDAQRLGQVSDDCIGITKCTYVSEGAPKSRLVYTLESVGLPAIIEGGGSSFAPSITGSISINGESVSFDSNTAAEAVEKLQELCDRTNVNIMVMNGQTLQNYTSGGAQAMLYTKEAGSGQKIEMGGDAHILSMFGFSPSTATGTDAVISGEKYDPDNGESFNVITTGNNVKLIGANNNRIELEFQLAKQPNADGTFNMKNGMNLDKNGMANFGTDYFVDLTDFGSLTIQLGANKNQELKMQIQDISAKALGIEYLNIKSSDGARKAIKQCDDAISVVSSVRAYLGACQNRLQHTTNNLDVSAESVAAAKSRIFDADVAWEMTQLTQNNVISQAGIAILAQANQRPQQILQLIQ